MIVFRWILLSLVSCSFAVNLLVDNTLNMPVQVVSKTSIASIDVNSIAANSKQNIVISSTVVGDSARAVIEFYQLDGILLQRLLLVIDGPFGVTRAVCVPISACAVGNPKLNDKTNVEFQLS